MLLVSEPSGIDAAGTGLSLKASLTVFLANYAPQGGRICEKCTLNRRMKRGSPPLQRKNRGGDKDSVILICCASQKDYKKERIPRPLSMRIFIGGFVFWFTEYKSVKNQSKARGFVGGSYCPLTTCTGRDKSLV